MNYSELESGLINKNKELERENSHLKLYKVFYERFSAMIKETDRVNVTSKLISSKTLAVLLDTIVPEIGNKKPTPLTSIDKINFRL